jgi:hypothetical protein
VDEIKITNLSQAKEILQRYSKVASEDLQNDSTQPGPFKVVLQTLALVIEELGGLKTKMSRLQSQQKQAHRR